MITIVDDKNKTFQEFIISNVNAISKGFQSTSIKSINKMITEQLEIMHITMVKTIQDAMIQLQTAQVI